MKPCKWKHFSIMLLALNRVNSTFISISYPDHIKAISYLATQIYTDNRWLVRILDSHSTRKSSRSAYVSEPSSSASQSSITLFRLRSLLEDAEEDFVLLPLLPLFMTEREDLFLLAAFRIEIWPGIMQYIKENQGENEVYME